MSLNELRQIARQFNLRQPRGCKKDQLIRIINDDFIRNPKIRGEMKHIFDSFGLRFDNNEFKPKEQKKIKLK